MSALVSELKLKNQTEELNESKSLSPSCPNLLLLLGKDIYAHSSKSDEGYSHNQNRIFTLRKDQVFQIAGELVN